MYGGALERRLRAVIIIPHAATTRDRPGPSAKQASTTYDPTVIPSVSPAARYSLRAAGAAIF